MPSAELDVGVVVYNAASVPIGPFLDNSDEAVQHAVDVNVRGPLRTVRTLVPAMCDRGRGAVVLVSSLSGLQGTPHVAVYAATKAFNTHLAESLWYELAPHSELTSWRAVPGPCPRPGYAQDLRPRRARHVGLRKRQHARRSIGSTAARAWCQGGSTA